MPQNLVIRLPNWVGDAVMATPALRSMRLGFPEARITVLGKPGILKVLDGLDSFDQSLEVGTKGPGQAFALGKILRKSRFDMGLLLPNSFSSALGFFLGGVKNRTGYALNGRSLFLHHAQRPVMQGLKRKPSPMIGYYLELARFAGGLETDDRMELKTVPTQDQEAERFLMKKSLLNGQCLVGINPGASFGPSKEWTPEGFACLADRVCRDLKGKVVMLCGPGEESVADAISRKLSLPLVDTSRQVLPLPLLKSVIARLDALVTTDTGPRHMATALGIPSLVIMGPTDPRYSFSSRGKTLVIRREVPCGPCHKKVCDLKQDFHQCMTLISGDEVFEALVSMLNERKEEGKGEAP